MANETWKTVDLKKVYANRAQGGGALTDQYPSNWYSSLMVNTGQWKDRLRRYDQMDSSVDISRALDIMAEDISSEDAGDEKSFVLKYDDETQFNKSQMKALNAALKQWRRATGMETKFYDRVREALKNGAIFFRKKPNGKLQKIAPERIEGYRVAREDPDMVTHYLLNPHAMFENANKDSIAIVDSSTTSNQPVPVEDLFIIKFGEAAYGTSILEKVYRAWRQLTLLEDAVIIYRIVRAPERRIFNIFTGNMPAKKAEAYLESVKNKMRQAQVIKNGEIDSDYNPASMQEDIFIAVNGDGTSSRVETLPGGDNLGRIEDLMYFNKKLATALRIPPSYLDIYSAEMDGGQANDGKVGTAYMAELRYIGYVRRLQKQIAAQCFEDFKAFCKTIGVKVPEGVYMDLEPPQSFAVYKENEMNAALLNVYGSADSIQSLSKRESLRRYAAFTEEDLVTNEEEKLLELGYSPEEIKKMPVHERRNKVYHEGSMFPNGKADEEGFGGFGGGDEPPKKVVKPEIGEGGGFASRDPSTRHDTYKTKEELGLDSDEKHPAEKE